jgi:hypothetical protein
MSFTVRIENTEGLERALRLDGDRIMRGALTAGAVIVEAQAKRDVHQVSGKLHDSTGTTVDGHGWTTAAHIGPRPGYGGPRTSRSGPKGKAQNPTRRVNRSDPRDYARRYNLGFHGTDSLGRHYDQRPNRYLIEALHENTMRIGQAVKRRLEQLISEALR